MPVVGPSKQRNQNRKRRVGASEKNAKRSKKGNAPLRVVEYISVPKHWFSDPLNHSMTTSVRPPTRLTRRKQQVVTLRMPEEVFIDLMKPVATGDIPEFAWIDEAKTQLKPTTSKPNSTVLEYNYTVAKPSVVDAIWRLHEVEEKRTKHGKVFRRGHGSARLHLSAAAAARGELSDLLSQVTGNVIIKFKVPKNSRTMPTLVIKFSVSTMDRTGNVEWVNNYQAKTREALRNRMKHHLAEMKANAEYPTLTHMVAKGGGIHYTTSSRYDRAAVGCSHVRSYMGSSLPQPQSNGRLAPLAVVRL